MKTRTLILTLLTCLCACTSYRDEISELHKEIGSIRNEKISTIDEQVKNIQVSITELETYKTALDALFREAAYELGVGGVIFFAGLNSAWSGWHLKSGSSRIPPLSGPGERCGISPWRSLWRQGPGSGCGNCPSCDSRTSGRSRRWRW